MNEQSNIRARIAKNVLNLSKHQHYNIHMRYLKGSQPELRALKRSR